LLCVVHVIFSVIYGVEGWKDGRMEEWKNGRRE
jgi:hypothetical protein